MAFGFSSNAPHLFLTLAEGRAVFELQSFYAMRPMMRMFPKGDGHPVIAFPGLGASDLSTRPMRRMLADLGYKTHGWGLGRNRVFNPERKQAMRDLVKSVADKEGRKVSLIGWSLGGIFVRELAKHAPEYVRSVITLGSPITGEMDQTHATGVYERINKENIDRARYKTLSTPPSVPTTSIFTKTDGIVHWRGSIQEPRKGQQTENIEVPASHLGIGVNPIALYVIADRLAQALGEWEAFDPNILQKLVMKPVKAESAA